MNSRQCCGFESGSAWIRIRVKSRILIRIKFKKLRSEPGRLKMQPWKAVNALSGTRPWKEAQITLIIGRILMRI
jgi:hypothetical protein